MGRIKDIWLKIFNWGKRRRFLSVLLCILLMFFCFKGIIWIYNDIAYGRFVKVGEKHIDDTWHSNLYETYNDTIEFFIQPNIYTNNNTSTKKIAKRLGDVPISYLPEDVYNINKDFIFFEKVGNGFLYNLNEKNKKLELIRNIDGFNSHNLNTRPVMKYFTEGENKVICTNNGSTNKTITIENTGSVREIIKLNNENLLLFFDETHNDPTFKYSYRYYLKDNKLYKINTSEISYLNGLHNKLIYLGNNKFLFLQSTVFDKLTDAMLFSLENNKFIEQKLGMPRNNPLFGFSTDNPLVLNENQILFVGGIKGEMDISWRTRQCFLYDIKRNKIIKINNFPFPLKKIEFLKTKNKKFYIPVIYKHGGHTKHFIYKYKKGRFIL